MAPLPQSLFPSLGRPPTRCARSLIRLISEFDCLTLGFPTQASEFVCELCAARRLWSREIPFQTAHYVSRSLSLSNDMWNLLFARRTTPMPVSATVLIQADGVDFDFGRL